MPVDSGFPQHGWKTDREPKKGGSMVGVRPKAWEDLRRELMRMRQLKMKSHEEARPLRLLEGKHGRRNHPQEGRYVGNKADGVRTLPEARGSMMM